MMPNGEGLLLLAKAPSPELPARAAQGLEPRPEYAVLADALGARIISFNDLAREGVLVRVVAKALGPLTALAVTGDVHERRRAAVQDTGDGKGGQRTQRLCDEAHEDTLACEVVEADDPGAERFGQDGVFGARLEALRGADR